ncbi:DJ-1/PfpI family protein [Ferruginibacter sp.]
MEIVIFLYNGVTALDAIGPYEVLSKLPGANVKFVAEEKGVIVSDNHFLKLIAEYDISEISTADILLIPGSVIGFVREIKKETIKAWIRKIHESTIWTASVCTGSFILAAAGLLAGLQVATHWAALHLLREYGAIPSNKRFIQEGKIITAQGVSAGIDMALYIASQIAGIDEARSYQLLIEYFPEPPLGINLIEDTPQEIYTMAKKVMNVDIKKDLSFTDFAKNLPALMKFRGRNILS